MLRAFEDGREIDELRKEGRPVSVYEGRVNGLGEGIGTHGQTCLEVQWHGLCCCGRCEFEKTKTKILEQMTVVWAA